VTDAPPPIEQDARPVLSHGSPRELLRALYHGRSLTAVRFRTAWLVIDIAIIAFFLAAPLLRDEPWFLAADYTLAAVLAVDLAARAFAYPSLRAFLLRLSTWLDVLILLTMLFPEWLFNLGFLRALRLWTLVNSEVFWDTVLKRYDGTRVEEITRAVAALLTFVFVMTGVRLQPPSPASPEGPEGWVDSLYFTITSLTTTGYGDVTLPGTGGKLLSIVIMVSGITLFVRLAQAIFRPVKVRFRMPDLRADAARPTRCTARRAAVPCTPTTSSPPRRAGRRCCRTSRSPVPMRRLFCAWRSPPPPSALRPEPNALTRTSPSRPRASPFLWLEEVEWSGRWRQVRALERPLAELLQVRSAATPTCTRRRWRSATPPTAFPWPGDAGERVDNFWQDKTNVRGLGRRTTLDRYRTAEPGWETILDLDALSTAEKANWVYKGASAWSPTRPAAWCSCPTAARTRWRCASSTSPRAPSRPAASSWARASRT
jgi:voltage-gated potassium channel